MNITFAVIVILFQYINLEINRNGILISILIEIVYYFYINRNGILISILIEIVYNLLT